MAAAPRKAGPAGAVAATPAAAATPAPASAVPNGGRYAVDRWIELTNRGSPWWAKSTDLGLSLQLHEVHQLAEAFQQGEIIQPAVERLLRHARHALTSDGCYCQREFKAEAKRLSETLKEAEGLLPGGNAIAAVEGVQALFEQVDLLKTLRRHLGEAAKNPKDVDAFMVVDEILRLYDAELAFVGYSVEWRNEAAKATRDAFDMGKSLDDAIEEGLAHAGLASKPIDYEVVLPVPTHRDAPGAQIVSGIRPARDVEREAASWPNNAALLAELDGTGVALRATVQALDVDGAAARARDELDRDRAAWELQGGLLNVSNTMYLRVPGDTLMRPTTVTLDLRPAGLKEFANARRMRPDDRGIRRIGNAIDQLASGRNAPRGAALSDLWAVAEALFGGVATDRPVEVTDRLGGVAQMLFVRDLLRSLAAGYDAAAVQSTMPARQPGDGDATWVLSCLDRDFDEVGRALDALVAADKAIEWVRTKRILRWDRFREVKGPRKGQLEGELDAINEGIVGVGNRAYLVRNLFLHQGDPTRAAAMGVTLPVFAAVLKAASGWINQRAGEYRPPLVQAELAELQIRHVAEAYKSRPRSGPAPLPDFVDLSDD